MFHSGLRLDIGRWAPAGALIVLLCAPDMGADFDKFYTSFCVVVALPAIVLASASDQATRNESFVAKWCGKISYPLYAIHYPIVRLASVIIQKVTQSGSFRTVMVSIVVAGLCVLSAAVFILYDKPVRRWLSAVLFETH